MKFRPCIDIHAGVVKQIVGSTLRDEAEKAETEVAPVENFVASKSAGSYAQKYKEDGLRGGHIIMLGPNCEAAAIEALSTYPGGMQIGGGINVDNALTYLNHGASHVIVTSFVFQGGEIDFDRLKALVALVGKDKLVIDLSCRKKQGDPSGLFFVVTNKWTRYTDFPVTVETLQQLSQYCDEFLVHGVDVEGKKAGIEEDLVELLGKFVSSTLGPNPNPTLVTYAGGIRSLADVELVNDKGCGKVDCTVGSALDMFGGGFSYQELVEWHNKQE